MGVLADLHDIVSGRHQYAQDWKIRTGRQVFGYMCSYVPEQLIYAAGILPVRVRGAHRPQDVAEQFVPAMFCAVCRDCLAQGLLGKYDYLDGIVTAHSCIHMRQAFNSWVKHLSTPYSYYVSVPGHMQSPRARVYLAAELEEFRRSLEKWIGTTVSDASIADAVEVYNENSRLLRMIYDLRKPDPPLLSGTEAMLIVMAGMVMDKQEHNVLLRRVLEELKGRANSVRLAPRVMALGSDNDDIDLFGMIESLGANFVIDEQCTGSRYFWNQINPEPKPLAALATYYTDRPPCPHKDLVDRRRHAHITELAKDYRIQAAIVFQQKFCDVYEFDLPPLQRLLEKLDVPTLVLETDATMSAGQVRTRVEAFLEMLVS